MNSLHQPTKTSAEVDQTALTTQASTTPDSQSTSNNNNNNGFLNSIPPYSHQFTQGMDVLSWTSSTIPYLQYDQHIPNMSLNFNPHNNSTASAPLDILSAERYNFGNQDVPSSKGRGKRPQVEEEENRHLPFGLTASSQIHSVNSKASSEEEHQGRQKKRARVEVLSDGDEDDVSKKARGRPRLDTEDKTAKDRRRTQIRNAQRAYRSRKETTISSLESQVQELKGTNEEMSNMFMSLYDFAVSKGLLQREPELSQHLLTIRERVGSLAKASADDEGSRDEEPVLDYKGKQGHSKSELSQSQLESAPMPVLASAMPVVSTIPDHISAWGYQISHNKPSVSGDNQQAQEDNQQAQGSDSFQQSVTSPNRDGTSLQAITEAVPNDSSFFNLMNGQDIQQYRAEIPSMETYSQYFPQEFLPLPRSYAYAESSLARRLHREGCERGYKLITASNPNPKRLEEVYALSLKYSTKEHIKARLESILFSSPKSSLQAWKEPFVHLGGAGTYYPVDEIDTDGMPKFGTGLSMGPFSEEVIATQQNFIQEDNLRARLPGFEGQWFDPNDVDNYLKGRGINIHDDIQFIQVDVGALVPYSVSAPQSVTSTAQPFSPRTPISPPPLTTQSNFMTSVPEDSAMFNLDEAIEFGSSNRSTLPLKFSDWDSEEYSLGYSTKTQDVFNIMGPIFNGIPHQQPIDTVSSVSNNSLNRKVTINVNVLVDSLLANVVCLGRSPGFKPIDVDAAIFMSVEESL